MRGRTLMVQGTASSVGKSIVTAGLCRLFQQRGLRVAPFKSQNMALNAFVTPSGGEIGRAQAVQAAAARVVPTVDMNPILLKPEGDSRSQVVVLGQSIGSLSAAEYQERKPELRGIVGACLERLRANYDLVVIEGAGSPAEINLRARDLANMFIAHLADAPVLLVGDIDRGGVFAALVGTLELLEPEDRARIAGFVVNKFRGDIGLLQAGLDFLTQKTGVPVLGVLPYLQRLRVAEEDSLALDDRRNRPRARADQLEIAVVRLPRISNYDDFQPFEHEPGVVVRFIESPSEVNAADLVVLPGTKTTLADLAFLRASGFAAAILARVSNGGPVLGICGGCQMLGQTLADPLGTESTNSAEVQGLGLLNFHTRFEPTKRTTQIEFKGFRRSLLCDELDAPLAGYEIHMGRLHAIQGDAAFRIQDPNGASESRLDGAVSPNGLVVGSMIHGLFDNEPVRCALLRQLRERRGLPAAAAPNPETVDVDEYDRLAETLSKHLDMPRLLGLIGQ